MFCVKKYFLWIFVVVSLLLAYYCFFLKIRLAPMKSYIVTDAPQITTYKTPNESITLLEGSRAFIIDPYYDDRKGKIIRILGIIHHKNVTELYCYLSCTTKDSVHVVKATIDIHVDHFDYPYRLADIICDYPTDCQPSHVFVHKTPNENVTSLTRFEIRNLDSEHYSSANFTVCTSTIYGNFSNALQLMQTIEMYRLLGAQKVFIYLNNCSQKVEEILNFYIKDGLVELVRWEIHKHLKPSRKWRRSDDPDGDIGYFGQMPVLNDCLYRNMYKSKFLVLCDVDEIILPFHHYTWNDMMETLQRKYQGASIFRFENHVLPQTVSTDGNFSYNSSWKGIPGFNLLEYVLREPNRPNIYNPQKMIFDPKKVEQTSVHSILKGSGHSVDVPPDIALVHHCRAPWQPQLSKSSLIDDRTIWKYNISLIKNVNRVIGNIFLS